MFEFTYFGLSVGYRLQPTRDKLSRVALNIYRIITEKRKIKNPQTTERKTLKLPNDKL